MDDAAAEGNHKGTITHIAASNDANYNGISIAKVKANISDDDNNVMATPQLVFLADMVKINKTKQSDGDIHSNGMIEFGKGASGTHYGSLTAIHTIKIDHKNTIVGNATSGADIFLFGNVNVTGNVTQHANVAAIPLPNLSYSAGGPNETVPKNGLLSLSPGSYDTVKVHPNGTLILRAGDYYFNILDTEPYAILSIDVSEGRVNLNVVNDLDFDEHVEVKILGGATNLVTFSTLQGFKVDVGKNAVICGNLNAPNTEVHFAKKCAFKGTLCAKTISIDSKVKFVHHNSTLPFLKESETGEEDEEEDDDDETDEIAGAVSGYELVQNYPNPFNPSTTISFALPQESEVTLVIYNAAGQLVRRLVSGNYSGGRHKVVWDGKDNHGVPVAGGVYLYVLKAGEFVAQKSLLLMK